MQALWMVVASLFFAVMGVCVKYASVHYSAGELVFYRGVVSVVFMLVFARQRGVSLATKLPMMHLWRTAIGVAALTCWFYAIGALPLATAMTLNYMSSVWIAAFLVGGAMLFAKPDGSSLGVQGIQGGLLAAVLMGFGGVVMVLRPAFDQQQLWGGVVGLLSGFMAAFEYLQVTALSPAGEPEERVVCYLALGSAVAGLAAMPFTGVAHWDAQHAWWLLPIGVLASLGQLCMTRAYAQGPTLVAANLQYTGIVFAALFGWLLFDDKLPMIAWLGMAVIMASGIIATFIRARAVPNTPHEEH